MALTDKLTAIADAIRGKTGKTDELTLDGMVTEIEGISGGGECDKPHVIEVDELPTENIDENAVYSCGGSYYKYSSGVYDVRICGEGRDINDLPEVQEYRLDLILAQYIAPVQSYHYAPTKPTEGIVESTSSGLAVYYIADENNLFCHYYGNWVTFSDAGLDLPLPFIGAINDPSESTEPGYYFVDMSGWEEYIEKPTESLTIVENGTFDVTYKANVDVDVPNAAIVGVWNFNLNYTAGAESPMLDYPVDYKYNGRYKVNFTCVYNGETRNIIEVSFDVDKNSGAVALYFHCSDGDTIYAISDGGGQGWWNTAVSPIIDFGAEPQVVHEKFKELMTYCATPQTIEEYDGTIIFEEVV